MHLKWNKTAFIEVFSAQNGLNVQDFFSFGKGEPKDEGYHIVSVSAILPTLCHQAGQNDAPPRKGTEMPFCLIIHNISPARRQRRPMCHSGGDTNERYCASDLHTWLS